MRIDQQITDRYHFCLTVFKNGSWIISQFYGMINIGKQLSCKVFENNSIAYTGQSLIYEKCQPSKHTSCSPPYKPVFTFLNDFTGSSIATACSAAATSHVKSKTITRNKRNFQLRREETFLHFERVS